MNVIDDRGQVYGDPRVNLARTAHLWSAFLGHDVSPAQVAVCMSLVKISRIAASPGHADSFLDARAYLEIAEGLS